MIIKKSLTKFTPLIGILILIIVLWQIDFQKLLEIIKNSSVFLLILASMISLSPILFINWRWQLIIKALGIRMAWFTTLVFVAKGVTLGTLTPGKLGELYRAKYLSNKTELSLGQALSTVIIDRVFDLLTLLGLGVISSLILFTIYIIDLPYPAIAFLALVIIGGVFIILRQSSAKKIFLPIFKLLAPKSKKDRIEFHFDEFYYGIKKIDVKVWLLGIMTTIIIWFVNFFTLFLISQAVEIQVSFWFIALISPVMVLINLIPISISGLGTAQATSIYFLGLKGIETEVAVVFSFLFIIIGIWFFALPGIILLIFARNKELQRSS